MQLYLGVIQSNNGSVGRMLDYLDERGLAHNTMMVNTSEHGFYGGGHSWFDKPCVYERILPNTVRYPLTSQALRRGMCATTLSTETETEEGAPHANTSSWRGLGCITGAAWCR